MKSIPFHCLLFLAIVATALVACESDAPIIVDDFDVNAIALDEELARDVQLIYSDSGRVRMQIQAPELVRKISSKEGAEEFPLGLYAEFFTDQGKVSSTLSSKYGRRNTSENQIVVRDSVVWISKNNEQLETSELTWDEKTGRLFTDRFVLLRRPEEVLTGYGFEADEDFTRFRIKATTGRLKMEQ